MDIGSTEEATCVIPVVYALLPDKKEETYRNLFSILKTTVPDFKPSEFHIDFEKACITGFLNVFPEAEIKGYNFHFNQALWRKTQELGLVVDYRERENIRNHLRMCAALVHLPPENIDDGWLAIMENSPETEKITKFNDYFIEEWLDSRRYWVCFRNRHRTTNVTEGWHTRLNKKCGKSHPNIYELLKVLYDDSIHYKMIIQQNEIMMPPPKRARKYYNLDKKIQNIVGEFLQQRINVKDTLRRLAYIVKYE